MVIGDELADRWAQPWSGPILGMLLQSSRVTPDPYSLTGRRGYGPPPRRNDEPNYNDSRSSRDRDRSRDRLEPRKDPRSNEERISLERQCRTLFVRNISVCPSSSLDHRR